MFSCAAVFLLVAFSTSSAVRLGRIVNASFSFSNWTNRSCDRCLCEMLTNPTQIVAVSCSTTGSRCQTLFSASTTDIRRNDSNVIFLLNTNWMLQPSLTQAMWKFEENFLDAYGNFHGVPTNNPTFLSPGIDGGGTCLYLNGSARQSVTVLSPAFLQILNISFTITVWIRANSWRNGAFLVDSDNVIFAQHDQLAMSRSFHLILRNGLPYGGFYDADVSAVSTVQTNRWTHVSGGSSLSFSSCFPPSFS